MRRTVSDTSATTQSGIDSSRWFDKRGGPSIRLLRCTTPPLQSVRVRSRSCWGALFLHDALEVLRGCRWKPCLQPA